MSGGRSPPGTAARSSARTAFERRTPRGDGHMIDRNSRHRASAAVSSGRAILALLLVLAAGTVMAQPRRDGKDAPGTSAASRPSPAPGLAERLGDHLLGRVQATWPDPPEWVAM